MTAEQLTAAQRQAIYRKGGPILVSAAAGSGKTLVIVERLMRFVTDEHDPCDINDFLIITFTKKAAAELRARIAKELALRLAEQPDNVHLQKQQSRIYLTQISTVHALCADLLREFSHASGISSDYRMLEQTEAAVLCQQLASELLDDRYSDIETDLPLRRLVDGLGAGRDDRRIPELLLRVYQTAQCHLDPEQWLKQCEQDLELSDLTGAEQTLWGRTLLASVSQTARELLLELRQIRREAEASDSLGKYVPVLTENEALLQAFGGATEWDELYELLSASTDLGRLPPVRGCTDPELQNRVKYIRKEISSQLEAWSREAYGPSKMVLEDLDQTGDMLRALISLTHEFTRRYQAEKQRLHALDFNDLEHNAIRLLLEPDGRTPTVEARQIANRYREIMVDEYQDTNQVQDAIFLALSADGKNRFMVGDAKQSIYRFRLADPGIFLEKYNTYPDAERTEDGVAQRIMLSHNFRSGEAVLEAVNDVFQRCMSPRVGGLRYGCSERLQPGAVLPELPGPQVELHCLNTKQDADDAETPEKVKAEAAFTARRIRDILDSGMKIRGKEGIRAAEASDIVILLRSPKNSAGLYAEALQKMGIPAISDMGDSVLDSNEVEILLCILKVADNAHRDIPLTGALLSQAFCVQAVDLAKARKQNPNCSLFEAVCKSRTLSAELDRAVSIILKLRELAESLPLYLLIEQVLELTGLEEIYSVRGDADKRRTNNQIFSELAATFCEDGKKSLYQFLQYVEQLRQEGGVTVPERQANAVRIMSIHKSKGLEYPIVFLCGLSKQFNLEDLKAQVLLHSELGAGCNVYDDPTHTRFPSIAKAAINERTREDNRSEELRILYVAMTRARDRLIMTYCSNTMEQKLKNLSLRLTPENACSIAGHASCLGDWILQTALLHAEAGALHAVGGKPEHTEMPDHPWRIEYHEIPATGADFCAEQTSRTETESFDLSEAIRAAREPYSHSASIKIPAKLTATQLKGRILDDEADDGRAVLRGRKDMLRRPSLLFEEKPLTPAQRGTAVHLAMQYLDFSETDTLEQIRRQLVRMEEQFLLTKAQVDAVDPEKLLRVFRGPLGELIREAEEIIREFKFSVLIPASQIDPAAGDDQILLQGVTDCCLKLDGALAVIDFKTDRVKAGNEMQAGEKYRAQLSAYSQALERIFGLCVSRKILYFFATDQMIDIE